MAFVQTHSFIDAQALRGPTSWTRETLWCQSKSTSTRGWESQTWALGPIPACSWPVDIMTPCFALCKWAINTTRARDSRWPPHQPTAHRLVYVQVQASHSRKIRSLCHRCISEKLRVTDMTVDKDEERELFCRLKQKKSLVSLLVLSSRTEEWRRKLRFRQFVKRQTRTV